MTQRRAVSLDAVRRLLRVSQLRQRQRVLVVRRMAQSRRFAHAEAAAMGRPWRPPLVFLWDRAGAATRRRLCRILSEQARTAALLVSSTVSATIAELSQNLIVLIRVVHPGVLERR